MFTKNFNSRKTMYFFVGVVLLGLIGGQIVNSYIDRSTAEPQKVAQNFIRLLYEQKFDSAQLCLDHKETLEEEFTGLGSFFSYKLSGKGAESSSDVWLHYFIEGIPGENRNISMNLIEKEENWIIHDLLINYHIDRNHKLLALNTLQNLMDQDLSKIKKSSKDIDDEKVLDVLAFLKNNNEAVTWTISKAENLLCSKNCNLKPHRIKFIFTSENVKEKIHIETSGKNNKYWVSNLSLIN